MSLALPAAHSDCHIDLVVVCQVPAITLTWLLCARFQLSQNNLDWLVGAYDVLQKLVTLVAMIINALILAFYDAARQSDGALHSQ